MLTEADRERMRKELLKRHEELGIKLIPRAEYIRRVSKKNTSFGIGGGSLERVVLRAPLTQDNVVEDKSTRPPSRFTSWLKHLFDRMK